MAAVSTTVRFEQVISEDWEDKAKKYGVAYTT
jgi:hypothetical protein